MISPQVVQDILLRSDKTENEIAKEIIVPCLNAYSARHWHKLREVHFVGGTGEQGNDVEYYELVGPDSERFYTGIQMKKGKLTQGDWADVCVQGELAFNKRIRDSRDLREYRVGRWILAATGEILPKVLIANRLEPQGKPVHFWDGLYIGSLIFQNSLRQFIEAMGVPEFVAASQNARQMFISPIPLATGYQSADFTAIDVGRVVPPLVFGVYLSVTPTDGRPEAVECIVRTGADEVVLNSIASQVQASLVQLSGSVLEAKSLNPSRPVDILFKGWLEFI